METKMNMTNLQETCGGVTAAKGYLAAGIHAGIKAKSEKKDLAIIYSEVPAVCGGVFTTNKFCAAPVSWCRQVNAGGKAQAIVVNSGNANACTGQTGAKHAQMMAEAVGAALNVAADEVLVCSTGVIGVEMPIEVIEKGIGECAARLSADGADDAATAIMTTDTCQKQCTVTYEYQGKQITVGGMAKGSGMIHPNMATMLCFITTDLAIEAAALQQAVTEAADATFNMVTVDGDTSTNDTMLTLANGAAGNAAVTAGGEGYAEFVQALTYVAGKLAKLMAYDGEGATKLLECTVSGAPTLADARLAAKAVVGSSLVKAAFYGEDANWGRIICAAGYSGAQFDTARVNLWLESSAGKIALMADGAGLAFDEETAATILKEREISILLDLGSGDAEATSWGCDLSHEYVNINADYRS